MANIHIHAPLILAAGAIFPPVCTAMVAIRFYARIKQGTKIGMDDWLTIPALASVVGACIAIIIGAAKHSTGYLTPPLPPGKNILTTSSPEQSLTRSILWAMEVLQIPGLTAVKASFVFFYRRVFLQGSNTAFQIITLGVLAVIALWGASFWITLIFLCPGHPDAFWTTLALEKQYCLETSVWHNAYGISDVILDFVIILLPLPRVFRLQMSGTRKAAVLGVFGMGALTIIASLLRMISYVQSTKVEFLPGHDTDLLISGVIYWAVIESGFSLICCCMPTVHSFTRKKFSSGNVSGHNSTPAYSHNGYPRGDTWRKSLIRRQGYREEKDSESLSDAVELRTILEHPPQSHAEAGGKPAKESSSISDGILMETTFETRMEPAEEIPGSAV